ncbi:hypothetical protein DB356_24515 [Pseudomonas congelans]|jgi:hypothetical protein|uniref:hypothetical protein n=1 Tax=Pseudomonas congelans TaxID=200452 RepID=UPI001BDBC123|nr:hypothetical protein [Pseudomonas congelans]QVX17615.1 hypothetical protein DB356_24515 [Pseudomonas congelans]
MNAKDIIEKVDFESYVSSKTCDPITRKLINKLKISDISFLLPPEVSVYDDQNKNTLKFIIEFRANNLAAQGRQLNGAELCAASLEGSKDEALRSWVPLEVENHLVIFIINSESFEIDGCMSLI